MPLGYRRNSYGQRWRGRRSLASPAASFALKTPLGGQEGGHTIRRIHPLVNENLYGKYSLFRRTHSHTLIIKLLSLVDIIDIKSSVTEITPPMSS